jgi:hypothetical protein
MSGTPDGLNRKLKQTNLKKEYRISTQATPDALDLNPTQKKPIQKKGRIKRPFLNYQIKIDNLFSPELRIGFHTTF